MAAGLKEGPKKGQGRCVVGGKLVPTLAAAPGRKEAGESNHKQRTATEPRHVMLMSPLFQVEDSRSKLAGPALFTGLASTELPRIECKYRQTSHTQTSRAAVIYSKTKPGILRLE